MTKNQENSVEFLKQLSHSLMALAKSQDDLQEVWERIKDNEKIPNSLKKEILRGLSIITHVRLVVAIEYESVWIKK